MLYQPISSPIMKRMFGFCFAMFVPPGVVLQTIRSLKKDIGGSTTTVSVLLRGTLRVYFWRYSRARRTAPTSGEACAGEKGIPISWAISGRVATEPEAQTGES